MMCRAPGEIDAADRGRPPEASGRAGIYRFFSTAFLEPPTAETIERLRQPGFADQLAPVFQERAIAPLRAGEPAADAAGVRQEFMDLFKVPTDRYLPPYEAVHRDSREVDGVLTRGLLMGPSTVAVRGMYEAAGAQLGASELPDHLGVELGFLAYLCEREDEERAAGHAAPADNYRKYQERFLDEHIVRWVPDYCRRIEERSETWYFRAIAAMTAEFCQADCDHLLALVAAQERGHDESREASVASSEA